MNWQPIETAPKDGTRVDLWMHDVDHPAGYRMADARWEDDRWQVAWRFWVEGGGQDSKGRWHIRATHWMPLPEPPRA